MLLRFNCKTKDFYGFNFFKVTENSKLSVDSAFSFGAAEANRKHRIDINSKKEQFRTKKRVQSDSLYNKNWL